MLQHVQDFLNEKGAMADHIKKTLVLKSDMRSLLKQNCAVLIMMLQLQVNKQIEDLMQGSQQSILDVAQILSFEKAKMKEPVTAASDQ